MSSLAIRLPRRAPRSSSGSASSQPPARDIRRRLEHEIAQHVGDRVEALRVGAEPRGIARREFRDLLRGFSGADLEELRVLQRQEVREPPLDHAQAMAVQVKIADDLRIEQRHRVGRDRIAEPGMKFLGHRGAADHRRAARAPSP